MYDARHEVCFCVIRPNLQGGMDLFLRVFDSAQFSIDDAETILALGIARSKTESLFMEFSGFGPLFLEYCEESSVFLLKGCLTMPGRGKRV
jgi:hypothetical protein